MSQTPARPQRPSWRRMLAAIPRRNAAAEVTEEQGSLRIAVRTTQPRWLVGPLRWLLPVRRARVARLDRVGGWVWRLCDGEQTVEQVVEAFADRYNLTFHEARVAVTGYLGQLVQRGALAIEMPAEDTTG